MRTTLSLLILCLLGMFGLAGDTTPPPEPPTLNRPTNFSHLMGQSFTITATATPTDVFVEDPIVLKVRIHGTPPFPNRDYLPQRKYLNIFPADVEKEFYLQGLPDRDEYDSASDTWIFYYQLLPRHEKVSAIPVLELVYYNSQLPVLDRYQPSTSSEISLHVKPPLPPVKVAPESMYHLSDAASVLRQGGDTSISWWGVVLGLILPPVASIVGYCWWRWLHPDQAGWVRRRQSRAARQALKALHRLDGDAEGRGSGAILTQFLHARLDLLPAEPTPQ